MLNRINSLLGEQEQHLQPLSSHHEGLLGPGHQISFAASYLLSPQGTTVRTRREPRTVLLISGLLCAVLAIFFPAPTFPIINKCFLLLVKKMSSCGCHSLKVDYLVSFKITINSATSLEWLVLIWKRAILTMSCSECFHCYQPEMIHVALFRECNVSSSPALPPQVKVMVQHHMAFLR